MTDMFVEGKVDDNWRQFKRLLRSTERDGVEDLIEHLQSDTDMMKAPASSKYHRNTYGGLVDHSLRVYEYLKEINEHYGKPVKSESIILSGLLHDLCKANYYVVGEEWDKEYKDATGKWRKKKAYRIDEKVPLGHGEKSVIVANRFIPLTTQEMVAIRWHMGAWDVGVHFDYPSGKPMRQSMDNYPLVKMLMIADQKAELWEVMNPEEEIIK